MIKEIIKSSWIGKKYRSSKQVRAQYELEKRNVAFQNEAESVLKLFSDALNSKSIMFWLDFGTLLGYYRENGFIKHDCDLDIGAYLKDQCVINDVLVANSFELVHRYVSLKDQMIEECYRYKGMKTTIDVFYYSTDENSLFTYSFGPVVKDLIFQFFHPGQKKICAMKVEQPLTDFVRVSFKGSYVNVPTLAKEYLIANYGDSFMIPNASFNYKTDSQNITFYSYKDKPSRVYKYNKK